MSIPQPTLSDLEEVSEAEIDEVLAEFGGDQRAAIRALLQDMTTLQLDANRSASRGFLRGFFAEGARPAPPDDEV